MSVKNFKLCHTFWNICDTFVTYLYSYLLRKMGAKFNL